MTIGLDELGTQKYVRLTTYKRDGTPVATPVWVVPDGGDLLVITDQDTGKVKRLRHTSAVLLTPCDMRGQVEPGAPEVTAVAAVFDDPAQITRLRQQVVAKYGLFARVFYAAGSLVSAVRRRPRTPAGLRISAAPAA